SLIDELNKERTRASERINDLMKQLDDERTRAVDDRKRALGDRSRDNQRIDELTAKLAQFELQSMGIQQQAQPVQQGQPELQQLQQIPQVVQQIADVGIDTTDTASDCSVVIENDPINIFRLCDPGTKNSVSVHGAIMTISAKMKECGEVQWRRYIGDSSEFLGCPVCQFRVRVSEILFHFLDPHHEVRALDGAVSFDSLQYWLLQLQQAIVAAGAAAPIQQQGGSAAAEWSPEL
ncbi:hypothetical protein PMAYCL1PPCAC_25650, partial [Pristionchus mayeri]